MFGRALATVALVLAFLPAGASADTIWTGAGNGVACLVASCPTGVPALGASTMVGGTGGVAVDAEGNVYWSDDDRRVKRVRADGVLEILAGNGSGCALPSGACGDGQLATTATLGGSIGVAVAASGDLFIADYFISKIRMVRKSDGVITTIAGNGGSYPSCMPYPGCSDGVPGNTISLHHPENIAVGADGSVYFTETDASPGLVRRLVPIGGGIYRADIIGGAFVGPVALALDPAGRYLYVSENTLVIRRIDLLTGTVTTVAGNGGSCPSAANPCGDGGPATSAPTSWTTGMAVDASGALYLGTEDSGRIRKVSPTGVITTIAGSGSACPAPGGCGDGGAPTAAAISQPRGLAFDNLTGRLWISELRIPRLRFIAPPPAVTTDAAQSVTLSGGTMAATLRTGGLPVTYRFDYGPTTAYGFQTATQNAAATRDPQVVAAALGGLAPGTTTHFRIVATDAAGVSSNGADVAFTTLGPPGGPGPGAGPTTATLTSAKLSVKWTKGVPSGTLDIKGTTDAAADLTVTLRRVVASGTKPVKGWAIRRTAAGAFTQKLALPKVALSLLPGKYRVDITGSSPGGKVVRVARDLRLAGPTTGIVRDGYIAAIKNGAPATRLRGQRSVVWAMFRFAALPTRGAILIDWIDANGKRHDGSAKPRRLNVESTLSSKRGNLKLGRYQAILIVGGVELRRLRFRLG